MRTVFVGILSALTILTFCRFVLGLVAQTWYTDRIAECDKIRFTCVEFHEMAAVSPWYVKLESKLRKRGV